MGGIRAALQPGIDEGRYPGAQIYVSVKGEMLVDLAMGDARIAGNDRPATPMTSGSIQSWQCNTKPVTGVAIAQLSERGLLDVDSPVVDYWPEFVRNGKEAVRVRHLLTHTARFSPLAGVTRQSTPDEIDAALCDLSLDPDWPLGQKARYTIITGYSILGALVRRLDGRRLDVYAREEIFGPLGMTGCWVGVDAAHIDDVSARMAFVYDTQGRRPGAPLMLGGLVRGKDLDGVSPGTGGIGPMRELARLYEALLASLREEPGALLKRETVEAMITPPRFADGGIGAWGLGVQAVSGYYGQWFPHAFGHEGLQFSLAFADPDSGVVVAATVNGLPAGGSLRDLMKISRAVHTALDEAAAAGESACAGARAR